MGNENSDSAALLERLTAEHRRMDDLWARLAAMSANVPRRPALAGVRRTLSHTGPKKKRFFHRP
jgi:hypothetical protein